MYEMELWRGVGKAWLERCNYMVSRLLPYHGYRRSKHWAGNGET